MLHENELNLDCTGTKVLKVLFLLFLSIIINLVYLSNDNNIFPYYHVRLYN